VSIFNFLQYCVAPSLWSNREFVLIAFKLDPLQVMIYGID